jgi:glycosyltransferase involved in cell wall biosynthesis
MVPSYALPRILHVARWLHPTVGGSEAYIAAASHEFARRGNAVLQIAGTLRADDPPSKQVLPSGVEVVRLPALYSDPGRPFANMVNEPQCVDALRLHVDAFRPDVVFAHLVKPALASAVLSAVNGIRHRFFVPHMPLTDPEDPEFVSQSMSDWTGIIAVSTWHKRIIEKMLPDATIHVVHPGIQGKRFESAEPRVDVVRIRKPGEVVIALPSRLDAWKGQQVFVNALPLLEEIGVRARLALTSGRMLANSTFRQSAEADLFENARAHGMEDRLHFFDVPPEQMPSFMHAADVIGFASHGTETVLGETFGIAPVEAMATGIPVVATVSGGMQDYFVDGVNGIEVMCPAFGPPDAGDVADAVRFALDQQKHLVRGAHETSRKFSMDYFVSRLTAVMR